MFAPPVRPAPLTSVCKVLLMGLGVGEIEAWFSELLSAVVFGMSWLAKAFWNVMLNCVLDTSEATALGALAVPPNMANSPALILARSWLGVSLQAIGGEVCWTALLLVSVKVPVTGPPAPTLTKFSTCTS